MLKSAYLVKPDQSATVEALRRLLEAVPVIRIEEIQAGSSGGRGPDLFARLRVDGRLHDLVCESTPNGQPRYARAALLELRNYVTQNAPQATPIFIAPYISPAVRQLCEAEHVGYFDFEGNARIAFGGVFIERAVEHKNTAEQRELKSLFKPRSTQVLRTILRDPSRPWRVTELSAISGVSLGHVSNVRKGLIDREWARASASGLILSEPDALLDAWRDNYAEPPGRRVRFYTPLHGSAFDDAARVAMGDASARGRTAFASFSAARWIAAYARTSTQYFFTDEEGLHKMRTALNLAPVSTGENVVITVPKDLGLLSDTTEPAAGAICTSAVQTYLDLSIAGERGAEAAEHLRLEALSWQK